MAECKRFICKICGKAIEAWSDGNPYFIDSLGKKHYAHHPDHERLSQCIGNDSPHLCLVCAEEFMVDSRSPITQCPKCGSADIADIYLLEGKKCPACIKGVFDIDPDFYCIS